MKIQLFKIPAFFFILIFGLNVNAADPVVKVKFSNPYYNCATQTYSVNVKFQSNTSNTKLFGINIRFFYADSVLEFLSFGDFAQGYGPVDPDPPDISPGSPSSGMYLFGFPGPAEFVNGAVQLISSTSIILSTTGWTKLFNVSFHVDDPEALNNISFCPSVIWDLKENPADGGMSGSEGVVITVVNGSGSAPATENVIQYNWQYDGIPGLPYGYPYPVGYNCINTICAYAPGTYLPLCGFDASGPVNIPVTVVNFDNIGAFSLVFEYDPVVMTYVNNTPNAVFTSGNGLLNVTNSPGSGEKYKITMSFQGNNPISLSDNAHLTDLSFNYISGSTDLTWKTDDNSCQYADSNNIPVYDQPNSDYYINGMVVSLLAPITKIDSVVAVAGDYVTYAVRVWNFLNIHSGLLTLTYDPDVLVYYDAVPHVAIVDSFEVDAFNPGMLELGWSGSDTSLTDASTLVYLTFYYQGGSAPLTWFDNGVSCQYTICNLFLPLTDEPVEDYYANGNIASAAFVWTGENSSDWYADTNWINIDVPDQFTDVTIDPSTNPSNWPTYNGNFTLGEDCKNLTLNGSARLVVNGDFTINPGHTLNLNGSGILQISGDWTNSGIFNPGTGTVEFTGTNDGTITEGVPPGNYIASYVRSTFPAGMVPITGGIAGPAGNDAHSDVNIGFDFNYLGINYSQVRINTNGWISLNLTGNDATSYDNTLLFNTSSPGTVLAPWWDDLKADASATISYLTEGSAPSRIFIAEWNNILAYSSVNTARLNFQVKLYETSNFIEFCYGIATNGDRNNAEGASIGIKDAAGGPGNFIEATHNSTNLIVAFLQSNANWPEVNYRFSPPIVNEMETFYKIVVSKSIGNLQIDRDVHVTGLD